MLPFLLNNLKDEIIAMDFVPEGESFFIRSRQADAVAPGAFLQAATHHQTHVLKCQKGKSNLNRYRKLPGYSWLQAYNATEYTASDFHTIIYNGAQVEEHVIGIIHGSYMYFV